MAAQQEVQRLAADADARSAVAANIRRALADPTTDFEARAFLQPLLRRLPAEAPGEPPSVEKVDLSALIEQLDSDAYAQRLAARQQLRHSLAQPAFAGQVLTALKARRAADHVSRHLRTELAPLINEARAAWLLSGAANNGLPPVTNEQITRWIDALALPANLDAAVAPALAALAEEDLLDALARSDAVERVSAAVESRLKDANLTDIARDRLVPLVEWTRPALVAECWNSGTHTGIQHLLIGVPSQAPGAEKPSHFDYCDDERTHCVSGNSLEPGDYPVGVMFPHPRLSQGQFFLVNLPTVRDRLAYEFHKDLDASVRLLEATRKTGDWLLRRGQPLTPRELAMLMFLDRAESSRIAGKLLLGIEDTSAQDDALELAGPMSHHGSLAYLMAAIGTNDSFDDLRQALAADRLLAPTPEAPYRMGWIAALAIIGRDPPPVADVWLESLVEREDQLNINEPGVGDVGAAAAGLLVERAGLSPAAFGLEPCEDETIERLGCRSYQFVNSQRRTQFHQFWTTRSARNSAP